MERIVQDIRFGLRVLTKSPGFTFIAMLTLALGIGANSTIFSVVNTLLLRPLPFKDVDRTVVVWETAQRKTEELREVSYPNFLDWRAQSASFEELAAVSGAFLTLGSTESPERIAGELVSDNYFRLLGVSAAQGRLFSAEEERQSLPVALVSDNLWRTRFAADSSLIGRTIKLNERDYTVVGIMPPSFVGVTSGIRGSTTNTEAWIPFSSATALFPSRNGSILERRGSRWHLALGRIKAGVTMAQAQAEMNGIAARLAEQHRDFNADRGVRLVSLQDQIIGNLRRPLLVLFGAVGFVLLIVCANVANLSLARAAGRQKEIAVRIAMGATRLRLVRQLLTESLLLSVCGSVLGLILAFWSIDLLAALNPVNLPSFIRLQIDLPVLAFTLLITLFTAVAFGLAPALSASKPDLNDLLKEGGRSVAAAGGRARSLLVVSEVALTLVLLIGAGLMIQSMLRLTKVDAGFNTNNLVMATINLPAQKYDGAKPAYWGERLLSELEGVPGLEHAALASDTPFSGSASAIIITPEHSEDEPRNYRVYSHSISPGCFTTLGAAIIKGRDFTPQDDERAQPAVIVSEALARRLWPNQDAIGKRIRRNSDSPWLTVVGVAAEIKHRTLVAQENTPRDPDLYFPMKQAPVFNFELITRSSADTAGLVAELRKRVQQLEPAAPVHNVATMAERLATVTAQPRFSALLLTLFALVSLLLAAAGNYGVIAYNVEQRTREIGIRMALGAQRIDILKMVVGQGVKLALVGVAAGLAASLALTRTIASLLYEVSATDITTFACVAGIVIVVAVLASYIPARRALKVDPMIALRYE